MKDNIIIKKYLQDVLDAIENVELITADKTFAEYLKIETRWAVERGVSIIGEALYQANKIDKELGKYISNLTKIKGTRHIIIHDYDIVNPETIFVIVTIHLPKLKQEITLLLND